MSALLKVTVFVAHLAMTQSVNENSKSWYGLGENECYGQTCRLSQYCSDAPSFQGCRPCTNLDAWCDRDMNTIRQRWPSCEAMCERRLLERKLKAKQNETDHILKENLQLEKLLAESNATFLQLDKTKINVRTDNAAWKQTHSDTRNHYDSPSDHTEERVAHAMPIFLCLFSPVTGSGKVNETIIELKALLQIASDERSFVMTIVIPALVIMSVVITASIAATCILWLKVKRLTIKLGDPTLYSSLRDESNEKLVRLT